MHPADKLDELNMDEFEQELLFAHDPDTSAAERIQNRVESKYCPADLRKISSECALLEKEQQEMWFNLQSKLAHLFDITLGTWKTDPIELELKDPNEKPYHAKPYPVPHSQEQKLIDEVRRLVKFDVLRG